jgi:hypothetical protein
VLGRVQTFEITSAWDVVILMVLFLVPIALIAVEGFRSKRK